MYNWTLQFVKEITKGTATSDSGWADKTSGLGNSSLLGQSSKFSVALQEVGVTGDTSGPVHNNDQGATKITSK